TTVANTLLAAGSILASSIDVFRPEQEQWEVTDQDFLDFLSTIGAGRSALRAYYGFKYGQYRTKRGETVDVTPSETLVMSLSGTLPDRISNAYAIINNEKTRREATRKARNEAIKNLRLSAQAKADGDEDNANLFYKRAHLA